MDSLPSLANKACSPACRACERQSQSKTVLCVLDPLAKNFSQSFCRVEITLVDTTLRSLAGKCRGHHLYAARASSKHGPKQL